MIVSGVSVKSNLTDWDKGVVRVRPDLCDVEDIKLVSRRVLLWHGLNEPVPRWVISILDGVV